MRWFPSLPSWLTPLRLSPTYVACGILGVLFFTFAPSLTQYNPDSLPLAEPLVAAVFVIVSGTLVFILARQGQKNVQVEHTDAPPAGQTQKHMDAIVSNVPIVLFALDERGVFTLSEGHGLKALGLEPGEAVGRSVFEMYADVPEVTAGARRALNGEHVQITTTVNDRHYKTWLSPSYDENDRVQGVTGVSFDITERERAEQELAASKRRLQALFDNALDAIYLFDDEGHFVNANEAGSALLGYERETLLDGMTIWDALPHLSEAQQAEVWNRFRHQKGLSGEMRLCRKDGSLVPVEYRSVADILPGLHLSVIHDISERKETERALRCSEERYRTLVEKAPNAIVVHREGRILYVNPAGVELVSAQRADELVGRSVFDFVHPDDHERVAGRVRQLYEERQPVEMVEERLVRLDGEVIHAELAGTPITYEGEPAAQTTIRDISERKEVEEALRASEQKYRTLFERANVPVFIIRPEDEEILEANPAACQTYGFEPNELIGMSLRTLTADKERGKKEILHILEHGGLRNFESVHFRKDGSRLHMLVSCSLIEYDNEPAILCFGRDISKHKRYEKQLVEAKEKAEEMNRLKTTFLANMSHEIRTPLTSIIGFADVLQEKVSAQNQELTNLIRRSGERLMATLNSVLDLAKLEGDSLDLQAEPIDVRKETEKVLQSFERRANEQGLDLVYHAPDEPVMSSLDTAALNRVVTNLLSNALKFTDQGQITVTVDRGDTEIYLEVEDTGVGIHEEFIPHLFDDFKQESGGFGRDYEGTGLGLSITQRLARLMEGHIEVESTKGEGSTFRIRFPRYEANPMAAARERA